MQNFAPEYANKFKNMQTQNLYNQPYNSAKNKIKQVQIWHWAFDSKAAP